LFDTSLFKNIKKKYNDTSKIMGVIQSIISVRLYQPLEVRSIWGGNLEVPIMRRLSKEKRNRWEVSINVNVPNVNTIPISHWVLG